ncbi:siroheme synthase CysG [Maritalea porphyrae]|uniref:Siroheme synthase n=1 Tax=Maritalea porphyrae TaxID=880732 RepID=A0ABQ5UY20_9HYPH|nr:siroheme synthase CysG [Maritalea porphyrae]GLQ18877.1 siroheme synthase [Maritalea porphyrae]
MTRLGIFPVSYKVRGKKIIIVGGGAEALAKARLAIKTDAQVVVIARKIEADFSSLDLENDHLDVREEVFAAHHLDNAALVFVGDEGPDAEIAKRLAKEAGLPLNVVDQPDLCDFFTPAIVDRAPISVAISSEGEAPVLARLVRAQIEAALPLHLGKLASLAGGLRHLVEKLIHSGDRRRKFYQELLASPQVEVALGAGDQDKANQWANHLLVDHANVDQRSGFVHLVGAGPGAEDLLTLRAQRVLQSADVIVHDQLVPEGVVQMGRRDAERVPVGKAKGRHSFTQKRINKLLVDLAQSGKQVVRLKSGDPMIFGRAAEEIEAMDAAGIEYAIVPGVTAAAAAASDAHLPVTLRNVASGVVYATAHGADDAAVTHWATLAKSGLTLGIYMGKSIISDVAGELVAHGLSAQTPVGIVVNAGRANSARCLSTLAEISSQAPELADGPAIVFVGEAVASGKWVSAIEAPSLVHNLNGDTSTAIEVA